VTTELDKTSARRVFLKAGLVVLAAAWTAEAEAANKMAQKVVQYVAVSKKPQNCASCVNFVEPNACKIVDGEIAPEGWCVSWAPKPKA